MSSFVADPNKPTTRCFDVESLKKRCLGRIDLANRVLEKFNCAVENDIAQLEQAIAARNLPEVARLAHRVRGTSLSVSAGNLAEYSHQLECRALKLASTEEQQVTENLQLLETLLSELRSEYTSVSEMTTSIGQGLNA